MSIHIAWRLTSTQIQVRQKNVVLFTKLFSSFFSVTIFIFGLISGDKIYFRFIFSERERAVARPSVVCLSVGNARAPYSGGSNFPQYFYVIRYLGHPLTSTENFTEIFLGKPLRRGS